MPHLDEILLESEEFLTKYSQTYPDAVSSFERFSLMVDSALEKGNIDALLPLISYMESNEGYPMFQYISEARYLFRILNILTMEHKYQLKLFSYNTNNKNILIHKYKLTLFALRRILFSLSPESIAEAESFLLENVLSPFAIYILAKEELLLPNRTFFQKIEALYQPLWNNTELQIFHQLITTFTEES